MKDTVDVSNPAPVDTPGSLSVYLIPSRIQPSLNDGE